MDEEEKVLRRIQRQLKLIPNGFVVGGDDLEEIFSQNDKSNEYIPR